VHLRAVACNHNGGLRAKLKGVKKRRSDAG
jgi:hypothetical protein